ncbi:hypothetical protein PoB_000590100 [Plakobranchus ocellatus]|uniref:Uncharacterized protein n=1 Tax=Plakobranchus ocellatus TaxID=259542 RepID=A0AAV3Y854_9GAST|nr:hypothetical protein PoB_000590100 [Plakobranchus ocellatus]
MSVHQQNPCPIWYLDRQTRPKHLITSLAPTELTTISHSRFWRLSVRYLIHSLRTLGPFSAAHLIALLACPAASLWLLRVLLHTLRRLHTQQQLCHNYDIMTLMQY